MMNRINMESLFMNNNAATEASKNIYGDLDLNTHRDVFFNLNPSKLYEHAIKNGEAKLTDSMALSVHTGQYTGRSPKDKFTVDDDLTHDTVDWGGFNQPISDEVFDNLYNKVTKYLKQKKIYAMDLFCGADKKYQLPIRVVSSAAYHALFANNMFIRPSKDELATITPEFTVLAAPSLQANPDEDGTRTGTFIICSFKKKTIIIGGTLYSGEVKKGIFGVMNYLLPQKNVMPMHCSANTDDKGNAAVFFGLSGTGKTTLSADESKTLIGDDEHGWSDDGIFNFEGGCYAKTIDLKREEEPMIYATTEMPGTILENVILDADRKPDFTSRKLTENTRCSYPLHFIPNASETGVAGHPKNIIFLTADAFGVLPPISKLTPEQAMFHFISGYTAKVAGTERGVTEPQATFSACFGAPFMPMHPTVYAELLAEKIRTYDSNVWLVNTGWTGGVYGVGSRMQLSHTRRMLDAATSGELNNASFSSEPFFGLSIPQSIDGVPDHILNPREAWADKNAYDEKAKKLAGMFRDNFKKFEDKASKEIVEAGPKG